MQIVRWLVIAIFIAGAIGASTWWWNSQAIVVDIATVSQGNLAETFELVGRSRATNRSIIEAPVSGKQLAITLDAGEAITKDDIIARIGRAPAPLLDKQSLQVAGANHQSLRTRWKQAVDARKSALEALQQVQKKKANVLAPAGQPRPVTPDLDRDEQVKKRELELAERAEEQALNELSVVRGQLNLKPERLSFELANAPSKDDQALLDEDATVEVRAPASGHALQIFKPNGGVVAAGTPLLEMGDLQKLEFVFDVLTESAARLTEGMAVHIHPGGENDTSVKGRVVSISPAAHLKISPLGVEESRTQVTVAMQEGESLPSHVGDGYRVEGTFLIRESADVIKIPLGALVKKSGSWFAFRVIDGRAVETKLELGPRNDREASVLSGLDEHDIVILYPANRVRNQVRVSYR